MNHATLSPNPKREELYRLANAVLSGDIRRDEAERFERLVTNDPEACQWYVDFMCDAYNLHAHARRLPPDAGRLPTDQEFALVAGSLWPAQDALSSPTIPHVPLSTYFTAGWPMAYLLATVIFAVGLIIGAITHVSQPAPFVGPQNSVPIPEPQSPTPKASSVVARITGTVDCEWEGSGFRGQGSGTANQKSEILNHKSALHLGDCLALRSGLLEITYDTGACVILQGPVTYEIESPAGGYLSIGKLTARLEKTEVRGRKSEVVNQKPEITNQKSFAIRTPVATITDLGTEFGVEVTPEHVVRTTVLAGRVQVSVPSRQGGASAERLLQAGQAAEVSVAHGSASIQVGAAGADRYVRSLIAQKSEVLIDATHFNGSFESPPVGPNSHDADAGNLAIRVYARIHDVVPEHWDLTSSLQTKGTFVRGVTGEQYVVLQVPNPVLTTQFDGAKGHPPVRNYRPHTKYILTADFGADIAGVEGVLAFECGDRQVRRVVVVAEPNVMQPLRPLELDTARNPEFVGKPIAIRFTRRTDTNQLYVDNVTLKAISVLPTGGGKSLQRSAGEERNLNENKKP